MLFEAPEFLAAAEVCAELMLATHLVDGRLRRTSRDGTAGTAAGVLEDYGAFADGLFLLHQATGRARWLEQARALVELAWLHFHDDGRFFDTADDAEALIKRPWDPTDNATPSGQSLLAMASVTLLALDGAASYREPAENALGIVATVGAQHPRFLGWALAAAEGLHAGPQQIAVVGEAGDGPLTRAAWVHRTPGAVVVSGVPDAPGVPLLADRPLVNGAAAAYVCRGMVCDLPVTTVEALRAALAPSRAPAR